MILLEIPQNLCDSTPTYRKPMWFQRKQKKCLKIAKFISQNYKKKLRGGFPQTPLMCMVCYPRIKSVISPSKMLAALSISGVNWSIHKKV